MSDEKILKDEILSEEELDKVAGGSILHPWQKPRFGYNDNASAQKPGDNQKYGLLPHDINW